MQTLSHPLSERDERLTLVAAILGTGVAFLDMTVVNVALPAIRGGLGGGLAGQQWVVNGYLLTLGALLLVGGSLGDVVGHRAIFVYSALSAFFFVAVVFLQQKAGWSPIEAGVAGVPVTVLMFVLSGTFGGLAARHGARLFMGAGQLLCAAGAAWLVRLDRDVAYLPDVLPGMLLFGLGLSVTVAPLTTTVMEDAGVGSGGIASGVNNAAGGSLDVGGLPPRRPPLHGAARPRRSGRPRRYPPPGRVRMSVAANREPRRDDCHGGAVRHPLAARPDRRAPRR